MAGKECAKRGSDFDGVMTTLKNWKSNGLETPAQVSAYMRQVDDQNDFLRMLYEVMGVSTKPNAADRRLAAKWLNQYGYEMGFVTQCAAWAVGKDKPMAYLDTILGRLHDKGITTMDAALRERAEHQQAMSAAPQAAAPARTKSVEQQQYTQREYSDSDDALDAMMKQWQEEGEHA